MDDRRVRRPPGALRDRLFCVLMAVSVVVATGTVPASAAQTAPAHLVQADATQPDATQPGVAQHGPSPAGDGPATAPVRRGDQPAGDQPAGDMSDRVAEATRLADEARADEVRADEVRAAEAQQAAEAVRAAQAAEAAQIAQTVTQVQQTLRSLGYQGVGVVDGVAGPRTASAIEKFQAEAHHPVTGAATADTLAQLLGAVDDGWQRPAPPAKPTPPAQPAPASTSAAPAAGSPAPGRPAEPATPRPVWTTYVANTGSQATIDLCAGGLTSFRGDDGNPYFSVPYLTIHNNCGGAPILDLRAGDVVAITGGGVEGRYEVVDSRDVSQGATTSAVAGLAGDVYLQTCYFNSTTMRIVGAVKVS